MGNTPCRTDGRGPRVVHLRAHLFRCWAAMRSGVGDSSVVLSRARSAGVGLRLSRGGGKQFPDAGRAEKRTGSPEQSTHEGPTHSGNACVRRITFADCDQADAPAVGAI